MLSLKATLTIFPPSANKMYIRTRHGPVLSGEARKFKSKASIQLMQQWAFSPKPCMHVAYKLELAFLFPQLENKGWASGKAKTRFKRKDVTNYIKVLEDIIAKATGVDDSCNMEVVVHKLADPDNPRIEVTYTELEETVER